MLTLALAAPVHSPHDAGVRQMAALCARLAYLFMCLTLIWGVLVSTGWVHRLSGRQATRSSHMVFATLTLAFGLLHAASFLYLTDPDERFSVFVLSVPLSMGQELRWTAGILGLEVMLIIGISTGLQRFFRYRRWLWLHRFAYPAVAATAVHSYLGAMANGHLAQLWLLGLTILVPTATVTLLRIIPPRVLTGAGLVEEEA